LWYHIDMKTKFNNTERYTPQSVKEKLLIKSICSLKNEKEVMLFLRDLLTIAEIEEFANRIEIVRLLSQGISYAKIAKQTGVSTTTVTRVAHWLYRGTGGYHTVVERLSQFHK